MNKMNILGLELDCLTHEEMYQLFDQWLADKSTRSHSLALMNVNGSVSAVLDKNLFGIYRQADLLVLDSTPYLKWARAFYNKQAESFYGPDLMLKIASQKKYSFFFYGGHPGAVDKMEAFFQERFPGIRIAGRYTPPFRPLTPEEDAELCTLANEARPDVLWVGIGSPKQDVWIHEHRERIRGSVMIASGAAFDFYSGRIRQAPRWIHNLGFEWLYRLTRDFKRLWKRYTLYNVIFAVLFLLQLVGLVRFEKLRSGREED